MARAGPLLADNIFFDFGAFDAALFGRACAYNYKPLPDIAEVTDDKGWDYLVLRLHHGRKNGRYKLLLEAKDTKVNLATQVNRQQSKPGHQMGYIKVQRPVILPGGVGHWRLVVKPIAITLPSPDSKLFTWKPWFYKDAWPVREKPKTIVK